MAMTKVMIITVQFAFFLLQRTRRSSASEEIRQSKVAAKRNVTDVLNFNLHLLGILGKDSWQEMSQQWKRAEKVNCFLSFYLRNANIKMHTLNRMSRKVRFYVKLQWSGQTTN